MRTAKTRLDFRQIVIRMLGQALALTMIAACVATGYLIFAFTADTGAKSEVVTVMAEVGQTLGGLFPADNVVVMTLLPAVIIGALSLGGMYLWNRRGS